jgi:signal transduction histidine kinase
VRTTIHAIRNHLAVAIASAEAFRDGVLAPTPERLDAMLGALAEIEVLLRELPRDLVLTERVPRTGAVDLCDVVVNEALAFRAGAKERGIDVRVQSCAAEREACLTFAGDPVRIAEIVSTVVGGVVRDAAPGGRIDVDCRRAGDALVIEIVEETEARPDAGTAAAAALKAAVESQGGRLDVHRAPGGGRHLTVTVPSRPLDARARAGPDGSISLL